MYCPKCGCEVLSDNGSCGACGLNLISYQKQKEYTAKTEKYCARCGTKNTADAAFCTECGVNFENYWKSITLEESPAQDIQDSAKTMEQASIKSLQDFRNAAKEYNLPLEQLRFFAGEDCHEPDCYGMYQEDNSEYWTVYKNRPDGTRYIAYYGTSEAEAANILYDKLLQEVRGRRKSDPWQDEEDRSTSASYASGDSEYQNVKPRSTFTHTYSGATYTSGRNINVDRSGIQKWILRIFAGIFLFILATLVFILLIGGFTVIRDLFFW